MAIKYSDKRIKDYLDCLASKTPAPGGGSSSALVGSLGCGLLSMVAHFTLSDKGVNGYKERAQKALKKSESLRKKLMLVIDEDAKAYEKFSAALKKDTKNKLNIQKTLKQAIAPPSKVCDYSYKAALVALELSYVGKKAILPDVLAAVYNFDSAFEAGFINIDANLKYMENKSYALAKSQKYKFLQRDIKQVKNKILSIVRERTSS